MFPFYDTFHNPLLFINNDGDFIVTAQWKTGSMRSGYVWSFQVVHTTSYNFSDWVQPEWSIDERFETGAILKFDTTFASFLVTEKLDTISQLRLIIYDYEQDSIIKLVPSNFESNDYYPLLIEAAQMYDYQNILCRLYREGTYSAFLVHLAIDDDSLIEKYRFDSPDMPHYSDNSITTISIEYPEIYIFYIDNDENLCMRIFTFGSESMEDSVSEPMIIENNVIEFKALNYNNNILLYIDIASSDERKFLWLDSLEIDIEIESASFRPSLFSFLTNTGNIINSHYKVDNEEYFYWKVWDGSSWSSIDSGNIQVYPDSMGYSAGEELLIEQDSLNRFHLFWSCSWYERYGDYTYYSLYHSYFDTTTSIHENTPKPNTFDLRAYPNPFNSTCHITAPEGSQIQIYDISGRKVSMTNQSVGLVSGVFSKLHGRDAYPYNGSADNNYQILTWTPDPNLSSGIYLIKETGNNQNITIKVVFLK